MGQRFMMLLNGCLLKELVGALCMVFKFFLKYIIVEGIKINHINKNMHKI